jgi:hypothetical protein
MSSPVHPSVAIGNVFAGRVKSAWNSIIVRARANSHNKTTLTHSLTELSLTWEGGNCAAIQEIPRILWNQKVHYRVHKSPPLVPILSQINPIHPIPSHPISLRSTLILSAHLRLGLPTGLLHSAFPISILYALLPHSRYMLKQQQQQQQRTPWL